MVDAAAFAAPWLLLLAASWRWAGWFDSNSKARRGGSRPGLISDPDKDKTMWTLPDAEGEALPPCPACDGTGGTVEPCDLCRGVRT